MTKLIILLLAAGFLGYALSRRRPNNPAVNVSDDLIAWLKTNVPDTAVQTWLQHLTPAQTQAFTRAAIQFVTQSDYHIAWLTDAAFPRRSPALYQTFASALIGFTTAYAQLRLTAEDTAVYKTFLAWNADPYTPEHQQLSEKILARLLADGLIEPTIPTKLVRLSDKKRQKAMVAIVQEAATAQGATFFTVWRETLEGQPLPEPTAEPVPPEPVSL